MEAEGLYDFTAREAHELSFKAGERLTSCGREQRIQHEHEYRPSDSDLEREATATHARWILAVRPERGAAKNQDGCEH